MRLVQRRLTDPDWLVGAQSGTRVNATLAEEAAVLFPVWGVGVFE